LTPIQIPKSEFDAVHCTNPGMVLMLVRYWFTWSTKESTVGAYGVTSDASVVAPP